MQPSIDLHAFAPEIALSVTILVVLITDTFLAKERKWWAMPISFAGLLVSFGLLMTLAGQSRSTFGGTFVVNGFSIPIKGFFLLAGMTVLLLSLRYFRDGVYYQGEYYFLLLCSLLGCLIMPSARDLITLFIAVELVSAPAFLMAAFSKGDLKSNEAGLKFFIFGVLSSAVMLYGMSLVYGLSHSTTLSGIAEGLSGAMGEQPVTLVAILMVVAGFGFKVSAVPFHFWAPDTYEGAPVPVAAFLSVASKAAGFVGLWLLMGIAFIHQAASWAPIFAVLCVLTMTIGNLVALQQTQIVRLLAYSSIAQAGYILLPFALIVDGDTTMNATALAASLTYIFIYAVMNFGLFAVVIGVHRESPNGLITDYAGLAKRAPALGIAMIAFLVSLGGIPPTGGFWAKFFVFKAAIDRGGIGTWLAAIMVVNSVIGIFYYLAVAKQVAFREGDEHRIKVPASIGFAVVVGAVLILAIGVYPDLIAKFFSAS